MSFPLRERGLKPIGSAVLLRLRKSFPLRERGLKREDGEPPAQGKRSFPLRERGLKRELPGDRYYYHAVVPLAGTWIETTAMPRLHCPGKVVPLAGTWIETTALFRLSDRRRTSFPLRERGLKPGTVSSRIQMRPTSFPLRERGLKQNILINYDKRSVVVPLAGTWIETKVFSSLHLSISVVPLAGTWIETGCTAKCGMTGSGRSPCGNVD